MSKLETFNLKCPSLNIIDVNMSTKLCYLPLTSNERLMGLYLGLFLLVNLTLSHFENHDEKISCFADVWANLLPYPNELFICPYPENLVKIRLLVQAVETFPVMGTGRGMGDGDGDGGHF